MKQFLKKIGIVILHFGDPKETRECLVSLSRINKDNLELLVVVVDNSENSEFKIQSSKFEAIKIVKNKKNLGFSGGNNVGIKYALDEKCDYILILNNDTIVSKNFLTELLKPFNQDSKVGIVSPKIYFAKGHEFHKDRYKKDELGKVIWYAGGMIDWKNVLGFHRGVDALDHGQFDENTEIDYATGACMLVKSEVFAKCGLFDEKYFLYYEDSDLCMKAKNNEYKIMFVPSSFIYHKNAASAGGSGSELQDYYITRNRLLFAMRYAPIKSKLSVLKESFRLLLNGRKWQKAGVRDFYIGNFSSGSYNLN